MQWTIYNPDVDLFINSQLLFELPSFGGLYTKAKFLALQPIRYNFRVSTLAGFMHTFIMRMQLFRSINVCAWA